MFHCHVLSLQDPLWFGFVSVCVFVVGCDVIYRSWSPKLKVTGIEQTLVSDSFKLPPITERTMLKKDAKYYKYFWC